MRMIKPLAVFGAIALAVLCLTTAGAQSSAPATGLYALNWVTGQPADVNSLTYEVGGMGTFVAAGYTEDHTQGYVWASAPAECLGILVRGQTETGIAFTIGHRWETGCLKTYLPVVAQ